MEAKIEYYRCKTIFVSNYLQKHNIGKCIHFRFCLHSLFLKALNKN